MHRKLIKILWVVCAALNSPTAYPLEPEVIFERISPSVWFVRALDINERPLGFGSGVVVAPGKVVTNCHVLARAKNIQIRKGNMSYGAKLEYPDPVRDLCQLSVKDLTAPSITLGTIASLKVGQRVYAIGNPRGLESTMSEGIISSLRSLADDSPLVQTTAPISKGSSGGGLFDSEGRLIGITTFGIKDGQNLNFAHPADWIVEIPERAKAQLAKYRESLAVAAAAKESGTVEKPVTGAELENLFHSGPTLQITDGGGLQRLVFHSNSNVDAYFNQDHRSGTYSLQPESSRLCMHFFSGPYNRLISRYEGCYVVSRIDDKQYRFKAIDHSGFIATL